MRWPWQPRLAEPIEPKVKMPKLDELGRMGTVYFNGITADEYNSDLQGQRGIETYDKMRRSDAQVQAVLWVCELPIRSARWAVEPGGDDAKSIEIAEAVEANLLEEMSITWDDFLRHALLMLPFGFMVFEKVWERRDGELRYRKLAPRMPASIDKWDMELDGGLKGVQQLVWANGTFERPYIPIEKLLVFTNRKEGANWAGMSLLRAAYKHWYYKDNMYRVDAIAMERHGVGVPYVKMSAEAAVEDYEEAADILQSLHAHERSYVVGKHCWEEFSMVGIDRPTQSVVSLKDSIQHHDVMIARSILAQFINLGSTETGSYALSEDQSSFFLMALQAVANQITDVMNTYAIKPLVNVNWGPQDKYPRLAYSKLEQRDLFTYGDAIQKLISSGAIVVDEGLRDTIRDLYGLPEEPDTLEVVTPAPTAPEPPQPEPSPPAPDADEEEDADEQRADAEATLSEPHSCGHTHQLNEEPFWRPLRATEDRMLLEEIDNIVEEGRAAYVRAAESVAARQIDRLVELAVPLVESREPDKVTNLSTPYKAEMAGVLTGVLTDLYRRGYDGVLWERWRKTAQPAAAPLTLDDPVSAQPYLEAKARAAAQLLGLRLVAALVWESLDQIKTGTLDVDALRAVMETLSARELLKSAQISVGEAISFGRRDAAESIRDDIEYAQYSAILDRRVCEVCAGLDGLEVSLDDPRYEQYMPPNPECLGGDRCRCVWILVFKGEKPATVR